MASMNRKRQRIMCTCERAREHRERRKLHQKRAEKQEYKRKSRKEVEQADKEHLHHICGNSAPREQRYHI